MMAEVLYFFSAIIYYTFVTLWLVMIGRSLLFWVAFIQRKHYRVDRLLRELARLKFWRMIFSWHRIIVGILIVLLFISARWEIVIAYLFCYLLYTIVLLGRRRLETPIFTKKATMLLFLFLLSEVILMRGREIDFDKSLTVALIIELLQPAIVLGVFLLIYPFNRLLQSGIISRANDKIRTFPRLKIIGITGSYGKTSTKEFLAHILSKKFRVLKTPAHINVDTGVAQVILRDLKPEHEIFIVEMGAYKRGEIKKICDLVHPQYAILTGLSDQHLELFGSLENIAEAKFELVEAVRNPKHIVANAESEPLAQEFKRRLIEPVWFNRQSAAATITFVGVSSREMIRPDHLSKIIGRAALNNLSGAVAMAKIIGMTADEIAEAIRDIKPVAGTMEPKTGVSGSLIIDDSYNANTEGVITALRDLPQFGRTRRILVFSEVIELGPRTKEDHARIASAIAENTDYVLLLPSRVREFMVAELQKGGYDPTHVLAVNDIEKLRKIADQNTVILFEGRGGERIMKSLIKSA